MASLGMIGAIGGLGQGLVQHGQFLERQEEADLQMGRQKDLQGWLLAKQDEYAVLREGRQDARTIEGEKRANAESDRRVTRDQGIRHADDDRTFSKRVERAPLEREIKAADAKSEHKAKSDAAFETSDQDAIVASTQAEAKQTRADKELKGAQKGYYEANADYTRGAKSEAASRPKLDPVDEAELKGVQARATKLQETIDKVMAEPGAWDPAKNPGQKQLQSQLATLQLRERTILQKARATQGGEGGGAPDPLRKRGGPPAPSSRGPATDPPAQPGMMGAFNGDLAQVSESIEAIADPQERANARAAMAQQLRNGGKPAPLAPTPAPRPAAPAPITPPAAEFTRDPVMDQRMEAEEREMGAGQRMQYSPDVKPYVEKVRTLKERLRQQRSMAEGQRAAADARARLGLGAGMPPAGVAAR